MGAILVLATEWASEHGGLSSFNRALCRALADVGCDVFCGVPALTEFDASSAGKVRLVRPPPEINLPVDSQLCFPPAMQPGTTIDWIIGHGHKTGPAAVVLQATTFRSAKRVHVVHVAPGLTEMFKNASDGASSASKAERRERLEVSLARSADLVVGVGPLLAREIGVQLHGRKDVLSLLPGLNPASSTFMPPPPGRVCLVVARAEDLKLKGLDIAAKAVGKVAQSTNVGATLVVRGAQPHEADQVREKLREVAGHGLDIRVREYTSDEVRLGDDLGQANLLLMPSRTEGFGLAALEGVARGVPILISSKSGLAESLRDVLGADASPFIVDVVDHEPDDSDRWSEAITRVLSAPVQAFAAARRLHQLMQPRFDWRRSAIELADAMGYVTRSPAEAAPVEVVQSPPRPKLLWSAPVGIGTMKTKPIALGDQVFVSTAGDYEGGPQDQRNGIASVELKTGREVWRFCTEGDSNALLCLNDKLFVGTDSGQVVALTLEGKHLWTRALGSPILAKPTPIGGRILVATVSGHLILLDKSGAVFCDVELDGPVVADPIVEENEIFVFTQRGGAYRLNLEALLVRRSGSAPPARTITYPSRFELTGQAACRFTAAARVGDHFVCCYARYTTFEGAPVCFIRRSDLTVESIVATDSDDPERTFGNVRAQPAIYEESAIVPVCYGNEVIRVRSDGKIRWSSDCGTPYFPQYGSPSPYGNRVLVPRFDGYLHCIRANDGKREWSLYLGEQKRAGELVLEEWPFPIPEMAAWTSQGGKPLNSPVAVHADVALVQSADGYLYAIGLEP